MSARSGAVDWRGHTLGIAWPTFVLVGVAVGLWLAMWGFAILDRIPTSVAAVGCTVAAYLAFTPMHEAAHGNVHGGDRPLRRWADAAGWVCGILLLAPYPAFRALHLQHHSHTNDPDADPDFWVAGRTVLGVAGRCLTIMPHYYLRFLRGPVHTAAARRSRRSSILALATITIAVGIAAAAGHFALIATLWLLPALVASALLALLLDYVPHHPHTGRGRHYDTRSIPGRWLEVVMVAQNYHLVHHLYPRVPFYRYRRVHEAMQRDLPPNRAASRTAGERDPGRLGEPRVRADGVGNVASADRV